MSHVWLIGLGGIGQAIETQLRERGYTVTVLSRKHGLDVLDDKALEAWAQAQPTLPQYVINTIGILSDDSHTPEKSISALDEAWLHESIRVNVSATIHLAKLLSKRMPREHSLVFAAFSARVSSVSDNHLGGWYSYRMSKAMLNMLIKNISIEWARNFKNASIFGYHPGTVDTPLSKPFQSNIKPEQLFSPEKAAAYFLDVLFDTSIQKSGNLIDWRGQEVMP